MMRSPALRMLLAEALEILQRHFEAVAEASASTSAERWASISAISPKAMPAVSVASLTPSGSVT